MLWNFMLIAGVIWWRGYAFFSWYRVWGLRKSKIGMAASSCCRRAGRMMCWGVVGFQTKRSGGSGIPKPPQDRIGASIWLLYDGFFLLPSCGRFLIIPKEILLYMVHYLSVLDSVCIRAKKYCGLPVLKNSYQKSSVSD